MTQRIVMDTNPQLLEYQREIIQRFGENHPIAEDLPEWSLKLFMRKALDVVDRNLHQRLGIGDISRCPSYAEHVARSCLQKMWAPDKLKFIPLSTIILSSEISPYHDYAVPNMLMSKVVDGEGYRSDVMSFLGSQSEALDFVTQMADDIVQIDALQYWEERLHYFVDSAPWDLWTLDQVGFCAALTNIGDYRVHEWEAQNMVNGKYMPRG